MSDDQLYLNNLLERIQRIESYTEGGREVFFQSVLIQDAVVRNFEVIGEGVKQLSQELRQNYSEVPWRRIAGFRDVLIHDYLSVDMNEVWNVVEQNLPELKSNILVILQVRNRDFKGPDFFAALGVPKAERKSWICWEEDKTPAVVIELLSDSTSEVDKGKKKLIYQNRMHVPEYFWYDPFNPQDFVGFRLRGNRYQAIAPDSQGRLVSETLELALAQ